METKLCKRCGRVLPLNNEYWHWSNKKRGVYQSICKECRKEYRASLRQDPAYLEKERESKRKFYWNHKESEKERSRVKNGRRYWGDDAFAKRTGWDISEAPSEYRYKVGRSEELREKRRDYAKRNPEKSKAACSKWREDNKERANQYQKQYCNGRYHSDPQYHYLVQVRNFLNNSFKRRGETKSKRNIELTGMTSRELYNYLLGTFKDLYGYDWDFQEKVHIDHIVPLSSAKDRAEIEKLCHYKNLRLIKAKDNLQKGAKLDYQLNTPTERMRGIV